MTTIIDIDNQRRSGMKKRVQILVLAVLSAAANGTISLYAQAPPSQASGQPAASHSWTMEQAVTSSVREAWALARKTDEGFFEIVQALAELSAQKHGVTPPDTEAAGTKAGNWIRKEAKRDPDQLLYVIVDHAVQYSANIKSGSK
jgi:hypothetical protein